jgi:hypothetical protein
MELIMDIGTFLESVKTNPACYFVAGIVLGYFLRGFVLNGLVSEFHGKRPSRYQNKKVVSLVKRSCIVAELNEPAFDWTDETMKAIRPRRIGSNALDQHGNEI